MKPRDAQYDAALKVACDESRKARDSARTLAYYYAHQKERAQYYQDHKEERRLYKLNRRHRIKAEKAAANA